MTTSSSEHSFPPIPGVGKPCIAALVAAGYTSLESVAGADYASLRALHGVGARGLERLHSALIERGLSGLSGDMPALPKLGYTVTRGHTGQVASDIKTKPTEVDPREFIEGLPWPRRVEHGRILLELFGRITGEDPVMWGPTMVGYGQSHYESSSGRHGDWFLLGFSPRQAKISLYGLSDFPQILERLGKFTQGASCVYVNKLEDIDMDILAELIRAQWNKSYEGGEFHDNTFDGRGC